MPAARVAHILPNISIHLFGAGQVGLPFQKGVEELPPVVTPVLVSHESKTSLVEYYTVQSRLEIESYVCDVMSQASASESLNVHGVSNHVVIEADAVI
jgi:hypothetical protein